MNQQTKALSKDSFAHLIPHGPSMCLFDRVNDWSPDTIMCTASDIFNNNPLIDSDRLGSACLLEYGAQAAAIHAGLNAVAANESPITGDKVNPAYVAVVKDVNLYQLCVAKDVMELECTATLELHTEQGAIYSIVACGDGQAILNGKLVLAIRHRS